LLIGEKYCWLQISALLGQRRQRTLREGPFLKHSEADLQSLVLLEGLTSTAYGSSAKLLVDQSTNPTRPLC